MARVEVYVHGTCPSSAKLLSELKESGLIDKVRIIDTALLGPSGAFSRGVWSVPWVTVDGVPAAADPVSVDDVRAALEGGRVRIEGDPAQLFMNTVLHSTFASVQVIVHGSLDPVLDVNLASAAVRSPLSGVDPEAVLEQVKERSRELYKEWVDPLARVAGLAVARMLFYSKGSLAKEDLESVDETVVSAILLSIASVGRAGIPVPVKVHEAKRVVEFLRRGAAGIARRTVASEQAWLPK